MTGIEPEFVELFRDEANERIDRIDATLLALEAGNSAADAVDSLFRDAHTIKGAAAMIGMTDVSALAHAMEDVLVGAREAGWLEPALTDPLLRASGALRRMVDGADEPATGLIAELVACLVVTPTEQEAREEAPALSKPVERRTIRVPPEKIDSLLELVGETVLHRRRLEHVLHEDGGGAPGRLGDELADELDRGARLFDGLKEAAIGMRTLPLTTIVGSLPRAVRDLARELGKEAEIEIVGAATELDRSILESLGELLVHLVRNAIAHGIETPEYREQQRKPRCGRLELRAEQRGGTVEVVLADDGRGVSEAALAEAERSGSLAEVLARPGFSTAGEVSQLSGRGVGLDAVKVQVETFGGSIEVRSVPRRGTEVVLRLPLSLALLDVLLVERAGNVFGLPLASVEEALAVGATHSVGGVRMLELRGHSVPLGDLVELVGATAAIPDRPAAVVVTAGGRRVAALCDTLLGKEEVVVKPLGPLLDSLRTYLGAAILGDGRIALLVDPAEIVARVACGPDASRAPDEPAETGHTVATVLVVEDSLAVRELQRSILEAAGYRVETARDGREALERLHSDDPFQLVMTDVDMPVMNGLELTEAIRAHPTRSRLPVVVVTSRGEQVDRERGIEAGADAYLVKRAYDQHALLETVERLVGR